MKIVDHYRNQPFVYLFVSILGLILLSPLAENSLYGERMVRVLFTVMMAAAVLASSARRTALIITVTVALAWLFLTWSGGGTSKGTVYFISNILFVAFNTFVFYLIMDRIRHAEAIDLNILCGGLSLYLLIALIWAVTYVIAETLFPGSLAAGETPIPWHKYLYFSLTTITTLGYGDILPASPFLRIWATMEAVTGVLYIAVLVARLVSLYRR